MGSATDLSAPLLDFAHDGITHDASFVENIFPASPEARWVGKAPVQPLYNGGKNRATFGARLVANRDDMREYLPGFDHFGNGFGLIAGNVDSDLLHHLNDHRIELAGFQAGAVGLELAAANMVEKGFGHLAAGAVMNADKQDFLFHG